ncbi:phosphatase PAP2 family protein [Terriglobus albidus]|uniref:phosphatase PAP2 family protein n=1 Tax=Terriglobus albidus TaxID=1592106 RepID=UPI0021DFA71D|nr:phosphatase PAP2 family protein [Terriglobus albidus]
MRITSAVRFGVPSLPIGEVLSSVSLPQTATNGLAINATALQGLLSFVIFVLICAVPSIVAQDNSSTSQSQQNSVPADQNKPPQQETPQPQKNPAAQANLPNAPSSLITAKPHGLGQIPLEDVPHPPVTLKRIPLNVVGDTYRIFTSPIYIRRTDFRWILPLAAAAAVSLKQDSHVARDIVSHDPGFNNAADNVSYALEYGYVAGSAAMFGMGIARHNEHLQETGLLSGEAEGDAQIFQQIVKFASFRERPNVDNYAGNFYQLSSGTNSSFISGHSITAWSAAAVIAAEYPSPWKQVAVYSGATATSLTRVLAEKHFPTDVLLGSAAGWMIGHYVVRAHHHFPIYRHHGNQPPV